jgi:hypothetical protein
MRALGVLSTVLVLQLGLAALLAMRHDPLAAARIDSPLLPPATVQRTDQIIIEDKESKPDASTATEPTTSAPTDSAPRGNASETARVEILKKDGQWVLPGQFNAPADPNRVKSLLDRLAALKRGLPIATSEASLRRFKVTDSDFERRVQLKAGGTSLDTIYLGTSPGLRKTDARTSADHAVYAVDLLAYEVPGDTKSWLNSDLLRDDAEGLAELDVGGDRSNRLQLLKQGDAAGHSTSWTDPALSGSVHIDSAHAETLVTQLSHMQVDKVLGTEVRPEWQQDHPVLSLDLKDGKSRTVNWILSKPASGDYYVLKSSAHPWFFAVTSAQAKAIIDAGARDQLIATGKVEAKPIGKS